MYQPGIIYTRTPEENQDIFKAWARPDEAFFAAGACHILGHLFFWMHRHEGFKLVHIKPTKGTIGHHMFASDGEWAFDFNGWTREEELLKSYVAAYQKEHPGWSYEKITYEHGLFDKPEDHMPQSFSRIYPGSERTNIFNDFQHNHLKIRRTIALCFYAQPFA